MASHDRHLADVTVHNNRVSTVFLGINHNFLGQGTPLLFETMIFGEERYEYYQERYTTWDEAIEGHKRAIQMIERDHAKHWSLP